MSGVLGYMLGFDDGHASADLSRRHREIVDSVLYGHRPFTVDLSYLDQIRRVSDHNFELGTQAQDDAQWWEAKAHQFRDEALWWRDQHFAPAQAEIKALREQNAALQAERDAALERVEAWRTHHEAAHLKTFEEIRSLDLFRMMATWLLDAHHAGRSERPEFAELRDMAKNAGDAIQRGDLFDGYRNDPETMARLDTLVGALNRP